MTTHKILAWHFLPDDKRLRWGTQEVVEVGKTYSLPARHTPELCKRGMHGSIRPLDALGYAPGPIVCRVRLWGDVVQGGDKLVARHREVVAMGDATRTLHEFAIWCAEQALALIPTPDPRSTNALVVKRAWLDGKATDAELAAAGAAAWAAAGDAGAAAGAARDARDAAWAAWAAARAAAWAAAGDAGAAAGAAALAARDAARDAAVAAGAAGAAWDAAGAAARADQNDHLAAMFRDLLARS